MRKIYFGILIFLMIYVAVWADQETEYGEHSEDINHIHIDDEIYYENTDGYFESQEGIILQDEYVDGFDGNAQYDAGGQYFDGDQRIEEQREEPHKNLVNFKMGNAKKLKDHKPKKNNGVELLQPNGTDRLGLLGTVFVEMFEPQSSSGSLGDSYTLRSSVIQPFHTIDSSLEGRVPLWQQSTNTFTDSVLNLQNDRLGIGVAPEANLHVVGNVNTTAGIGIGEALLNSYQRSIIHQNNIRHSAVGIGKIGALHAYNASGQLGARLGGGTSSNLELFLDNASTLHYTGAKLGVGVAHPQNTIDVVTDSSGDSYCDRSKTRCFQMQASQDDSVMTRSMFQNYLSNLTIFPDKK